MVVLKVSKKLQLNLSEIKKALPSEDVLSYTFETADKTACAIIYADGVVNKQLLGDLIARPLSKLDFSQELPKKGENAGTMSAMKIKKIIRENTIFCKKIRFFRIFFHSNP